MHSEHGFEWIAQIPGLEHAPSHVVTGLFVAIVLVVTTAVARASLMGVLQTKEGGIVPEPTMTYRGFFEIVAESLFKLCEMVMGHHDAPIYFPLVGSLFVYVFSCNILGLIPGFLPPTDNMNTTLAIGAFVFLYYNWVGLKTHGIGYLKHFMGPVIWLAPLMFLIEVLSHLIRPVSLAMRLRNNIFGDHVVLGVFSSLVPIGVPVVFYGLGMFVSFVQAFVFCLMTMVYISLSASHDH